MNICLEKVVYCDQKGLQHLMDNYAIRFRQILYVQIPDSVSTTTNHWFVYKSFPSHCADDVTTNTTKRSMYP